MTDNLPSGRLGRLWARFLSYLGVAGSPAAGASSLPQDGEALARLAAEGASGSTADSGARMLADVLEFRGTLVREVMRPRTEVVALPLTATEDEVREVLKRERYTRYPVYAASLDDIVGVFLAKDLWLRDSATSFSLARQLRETLFVPDTRPAQRVLDDLRKTRAHIAVVLDEFGGTAGIVTLEDLVEQVIGDINDEYDVAVRSAIETDGVLELAGSLSLRDVRGEYQIPIPDGDWQTIGGYAFARLGRLPRIGDRAPYPGGELEIVAMDGRRVAAVRVHRATRGGGAEAD
ncbi:MAG: HlyC/CorC family transporter [Gemmatimonadota bacterium]|nr:HlyC/CorC family transporter [Gemmatimonadota bacterium]HEU4989660.1 hemolysin family protein [Gemmatimonadaceae bacterium]